jgi:hypothetical protein
VAVTQNFVNSKNFEFVCLDMAPGYQHKGVCRAGLLALDDDSFKGAKTDTSSTKNSLNYLDLTRKEKRARICKAAENSIIANDDSLECNTLENVEFSYDISFLSMFLDEKRDHYNSLWSSSNIMEQRKMREWLRKLWLGKPGLRDLIWKVSFCMLTSSLFLRLILTFVFTSLH